LNTKPLIALTFALSVASSVHAQQIDTAPVSTVNRDVGTQLIVSNDAESPKGITSVGAGHEVPSTTGPTSNQRKWKTRDEVLAELQQAEANGTAMPTSLAAFDDGTHAAKYNVTPQVNSAK
jgi:hypothetical protein